MNPEDAKVVRERVDRFTRLGGVDLSRLADPADPLRTEVEVGTASYKRAVFHFRCELCGRVQTADQEMPPACTGPSWVDVHPLEPMVATI